MKVAEAIEELEAVRKITEGLQDVAAELGAKKAAKRLKSARADLLKEIDKRKRLNQWIL
jgi:hypothetical protein